MLSSQEIIDRIDLLAKDKGLSRHQFLVQCSARAFVSNLQKGQLPKVDTACKIAEFAGVSVDYLLGLDDTPNRKETISPPAGDNMPK